MASGLDETVGAVREQNDELAELLTDRSEEDWQRPSLCEGWSVSDVVLHLAQSNELAQASLDGTFSQVTQRLAENAPPGAGVNVDDRAGLMVEWERGESGAEVFKRWQTSVDNLHQGFRSSDPHSRVEWVAGLVSVHTLATTRLAESWIHTGDVAWAFGISLAPADRLRHIARLAWRTLPYAFEREGGRQLAGPVAFELEGPSGDNWRFMPDGEPTTVIRGSAHELCAVASRRVDPADTGLQGEGPDAAAVLQLVRTYA